MYFVNGRPRFWVPGFDTAHLVLPALLLFFAILLAVVPPEPVPLKRIAPPPLPQTRPTTILSPAAGSIFAPGQLGVVEGLAQPGGVVRLYWSDRPLGEPTRVGPDGRWSFTIGRFPPGQHILSAIAMVEGRYLRSPEVVFTVQAPPLKSPPKAATPGKKHGRYNDHRGERRTERFAPALHLWIPSGPIGGPLN